MLKSKSFNFFIALILFFQFSGCMASVIYQRQTVLEVVIFYVKPNVSPKTLLITANNVTPLLKSMPGFISRTVAKGQKPGQWIDIVHWKSLPQALSAAKKVVNNPKMKKFISLMKSYTIYHFSIKSQSISKS